MISIALLCVMTMALGGKAGAAIYEQRFDGAADITTYTDWDFGSNNGGAASFTQVIGEKFANVADPGTGDLAVLYGCDGFPTVAQGSGNHGDQVRVQYNAVITRGNGMSVQATYWGDTANAWGGHGGGTPRTFPHGFGFHGPLHHQTGQPAGLPTLNKKVNDTVHNGFNGHNGYAFAPNFRFSENGQDEVADANGDRGHRNGCGPANGVVPDSTLWNAMVASSNKANGVVVRVELGDTAGFKPTYSTDGGASFNDVLTLAGAGPQVTCGASPVQGVAQTGGEVYDTRVPGGLGPRSTNLEGEHTAGGADYDGVAYQPPPCTHTELYFGAGAGYGNATGGVWFDDIVIFDNTNPVPVELSGFKID